MLALPEHGWVFVHIPRTGGSALKEALLQLPGAISHVDSEEKLLWHGSAWTALRMYPELRTFAIIRNPWDMLVSRWRWVQEHAANPISEWQPWYKSQVLVEVTWTFPQFVEAALGTLTVGGQWITYCHPETHVLRYEDDWAGAVQSLLGCQLSIPRVNVSRCSLPAWTEELLELVELHCFMDIEMFDYTRPQL